MEDKEKRILKSAQQFFFRYGFKKTSLDEVAEDVGIGKGTIYNYFKNKEDLFIRHAESMQQEMFGELDEQLAHLKKADEKLMFSILHVLRHIRKKRELFAMSKTVLEEMVSMSLKLMNNHPEHKKRTIELLQEGCSQGIFKIEDIVKTAELLNQIVKMFILRWATMDTQTTETEIKDIFELIFNGIRS